MPFESLAFREARIYAARFVITWLTHNFHCVANRYLLTRSCVK